MDLFHHHSPYTVVYLQTDGYASSTLSENGNLSYYTNINEGYFVCLGYLLMKIAH